MTLVSEIIEAGYLRSSRFNPGKSADDPELISYLNRRFQSYTAALATEEPEKWIIVQTGQWIGIPAVLALSSPDIVDIHRIEDVNGMPVHLLPARDIHRAWAIGPTCYRTGPTLVSRGQSGDPQDADSYSLYVILPVAQFVDLSDVLDFRWPVRFNEILILDVAIYLTMKDGVPPKDFVTEREMAAAQSRALARVVHTGSEQVHAAKRMGTAPP
jgi:hypothetical protein